MVKEKLNEILQKKGSRNEATVAFIFKKDMLLVGLRNYKEGLSVWTAPGGRCEEETLETTLKREVFKNEV